MRRLRVLHLYRTYFPETQGGLEESIRQLCLATAPLGVDNTVFALARQPMPEHMELPEGRLVRSKSWLEVASCNIGGMDALSKARALATEADLVQMHYPWPFADVMLPFVRRRGQPLVVTYVSDVVRQKGLDFLYAPLRRYLLGSATRVVASSPHYAATSEVLPAYAKKLVTIPHCLGVMPAPDEARMRHWADKVGEDFFLFVGVLRYYKGLSDLVTAAQWVNRRVLILGDGPEGPALRAQADALGVGNVLFLGALPDEDKRALLALCRAVVFPSHLRSEAFGMTLLEGAQMGKPLVCCEIGTGTTWINVHGETGLVVPPRSPQALADAMNALADDPTLCMALGEGARKRWGTHFSAEVVGQAYRSLYESVCEDER